MCGKIIFNITIITVVLTGSKLCFTINSRLFCLICIVTSYHFISQATLVVRCMDPKRKGMVKLIWKREFHPKSIRLDHDRPEQFVMCQVSSC